jgi:hypothetical protein
VLAEELLQAAVGCKRLCTLAGHCMTSRRMLCYTSHSVKSKQPARLSGSSTACGVKQIMCLLIMQAGALWQHLTQLLDLFDCEKSLAL